MIYSLSSSRNPTPRGSNFNHSDFYAVVGGSAPPVRTSNFGASDLYSIQLSSGPTPRPSNFEEGNHVGAPTSGGYPAPNQEISTWSSAVGKKLPSGQLNHRHVPANHDTKELHMFMWSSSASSVSDVGRLQVLGGSNFAGAGPGGRGDHEAKEIRMMVPADLPQNGSTKGVTVPESEDYSRGEDFSFGGGRVVDEEEGMKDGPDGLTKLGSSSTVEL